MARRSVKNVRYDFAGSVVLVTGGARGQGKAHAIAFAEAGADVAIADTHGPMRTVPYSLSSSDELEATAEAVRAHGVRCLAQTCDVRSGEEVESFVQDVLGELGRVDVLINNAGVVSVAPLTDMDEDAWDEVLDTNLRGAYLCSKYVLPGMIERRAGKIINTGSTSSVAGLPMTAHYGASKHGIIGLTKSLATEVAEHGINVNAVAPGGMDTPMITGVLGSEQAQWLGDTEKLTGIWNLFQPDALLDPSEISNAMLWLASDAADFVTGCTIMVDAGYTVK